MVSVVMPFETFPYRNLFADISIQKSEPPAVLLLFGLSISETMASLPVENLYCPVCRKIFEDPVLLSCSHSFCKDCVETWWTHTKKTECPLCRRKSSQKDPPRNLVLRDLCDAVSQHRSQRSPAGSAGLCDLHSRNLRLFCLDHQQLVCDVCLRSEAHRNHTTKPVQEAALDYREVVRELLKPVQEKLELFKDIKGNFDQTSKDVDAQAQDTERQIKDVISMLQRLLQKEEQERLGAVRREKIQKTQTMTMKSEALSRQITALSDAVRTTEEVLGAQDLTFLQNYKTTAEKVQRLQLNDPQPIKEGVIDMSKHLDNLPFKILDSVKTKVPSTQSPRTADPEAVRGSVAERLARLVESVREAQRGFGPDGEPFRAIQRPVVPRRPTNPDLRRRSMVVDSRYWGFDDETQYP